MSELTGNPGALVMIKADFVSTLVKQLPEQFSPGFSDLIQSLLHRNPQRRSSTEDVLQHLQMLSDAAGMERPSGVVRSRQSSVATNEEVIPKQVSSQPGKSRRNNRKRRNTGSTSKEK